MKMKFKKTAAVFMAALVLFNARPSEAFAIPAVVGAALAAVAVSEKTAMIVGGVCDAVSIAIAGYRAKKGTLGE